MLADLRAFSAYGQQSSVELTRVLRLAMTAGALETATRLALQLAERDVGQELAPVEHALLMEALLMSGERQRALQLAALRREVLSRAHQGRTMLELLGIGRSPVWIDRRRPNFIGLARRIACGDLDVNALTRSFAPWAWLFAPELHLLFFTALQEREPELAARFLSRYLALFDLPRCGLRPSAEASDNVLARFSFERPSPVAGGPLVSVVVAVRNASATVAVALDSLLQQSYGSLEILVGDDASSDGTLELLRVRYGSEARVRLFRSLRNQGAYNLRNALAAEARGQLLTFQDADDLALPTRIASQVAELAQPGAVGCLTNLLRMTAVGHIVFFKDQKACRLARVSLMVTRAAFRAVGPFRSVRVGADLELFAALRRRYGAAAIRRLHAPHLFGLWSPGSATRTDGTEALEDGYRSPLRRAYSELVYVQHLPGPNSLAVDLEARLRASTNHIEPSAIVEVRE